MDLPAQVGVGIVLTVGLVVVSCTADCGHGVPTRQ
jgi:hypothetical protein